MRCEQCFLWLDPRERCLWVFVPNMRIKPALTPEMYVLVVGMEHLLGKKRRKNTTVDKRSSEHVARGAVGGEFCTPKLCMGKKLPEPSWESPGWLFSGQVPSGAHPSTYTHVIFPMSVKSSTKSQDNEHTKGSGTPIDDMVCSSSSCTHRSMISQRFLRPADDPRTFLFCYDEKTQATYLRNT